MVTRNTYLATTLFTTGFIVLSISDGSFQDLRTFRFKTYSNLSFVGAVQIIVPASSEMQCIFQCASNDTCQGLEYGSECYHIDRTNISGLVFYLSEPTMIKKRNLLYDLEYDPINLSSNYLLTLTNEISYGNMVYMKAVLLQHGNVALQLADKADFINVTYEFKARCNNVTCNSKYVTITSKLNGTWNQNTKYISYDAHTLTVNETFDLHVLVTAYGIVTYLKGVYLNTFITGSSVFDVTIVKVNGNMKVLELSL